MRVEDQRAGDDSKVISPRVTSADERAFYREANEAVRADFATLSFALHHIKRREERKRERVGEGGREGGRKTGRPCAPPSK